MAGSSFFTGLGPQKRDFAVQNGGAQPASGHFLRVLLECLKLRVFCKLLRMVVGAPGNLDGSPPWHEILHEWFKQS